MEKSKDLRRHKEKNRIAEKRNHETLEQREERMKYGRDRRAMRRNVIILEEGADNIEKSKELKRRKDKERLAAKRNNETLEQKEERLKQNRQRKAMKENLARSEDLDDQGQCITNVKLEKTFEHKMKSLDFSVCTVCKKRVLTFIRSDKCAACERNPESNMYTAINNMDPGEVPEDLNILSPLEELLIAKVHPIISIYRTKGQQLHYTGHVINFPQDVKTFSNKLPNVSAAINSIIVVKKQGDESHAHTDFRVCGKRVRNALIWLKTNNHYYRDVEIDEDALSSLPDDGNLNLTLPSIETKRQCTVTFDDDDDETVKNTNVPFLPVDNQDKQINSVLHKDIPWPTIGSAPIDEFRTAGYIACAFPTLFPTGNADLRQGRLKKVGDSDYFKFLMLYEDGRFSKHPRFPFFAMNTTLRWSALNQGKVFVRKHLAGKTMDDLKSLLQTNKSLTNHIMFYGSSIRGTKCYWFKRCGELLAMVEQLGTPTIFFTLSAADLHWPDLFRILKPNSGDGEEITHSERLKLMCQNPFVVATFFEQRGTYFIESIMMEKFNITDYWFRFKWQHRGSPHIHGIFWMKDAPNVDNLERKSEAYKKSVVTYFDMIASTWNPDKMLPQSTVHPCQVRIDSVEGKDRVDDYTRLLNKVQRHTVCSEAYCLRKKKGGSRLECRFKFPIEEREKSALEMEPNGSLRLRTKRNDDRLNIHNPFITTLWRANTDFQPIMSRQAVINYIAKYASKSEPQSESYKDIISSIVGEGNPDDSARKAVQKLLMKSVAERDYSAQEVAHILMGYPLYHCTRQFVTLTLKVDAWVALSKEKDSDGTSETFIDKYKSRPEEYNNETLFSFCINYYNKGKKWIRRRKSAIVQVYPKLKLKGDSTKDQREEYFRQKVLIYMSWRCEEDLRNEYDSWESVFEANNLEAFTDELTIEDAEEEEFEEVTNDNEILELEEYMIAAQDGPNRELIDLKLGSREIDKNYDWNLSYNNYDCSVFPTFMADAKKKEGEDCRIYKYPDVVLTEQQNQAMHFLDNQIIDAKQGTSHAIQRIIVQGKGGSGKSTLIKAMTARLYQEFGVDSFRLMAPTGSAAVNIGGSTIHSCLNIGISGEMQKLDGVQLRQFQADMKEVKFLIFDEYSMVGSRLLGKIDQRCREAKPEEAEEVFGGMCVYFLGDIKQLPPVMDRAPYAKGTIAGIGGNGRLAYHSFQKCIVLGDSQRQSGTSESQSNFRLLLDRLSTGQSTEDDWMRMDSRSISKIDNFEEYEDAMRLFPTNELTYEYNLRKLVGLNVPVVNIKGKHNRPEAAKGSLDAAQGLSQELFLSKGSRIMLRNNLWTRKCLVNGSVGTVVDIIYLPGDATSDTLPLALLVKLDSYSDPCLDGELFPLTPVTRFWNENGQPCSRTQFPITLAWAITIHKSQGMTLNKAVIDVGEREFSAGLTYVAFSRIKSLSGLVVDPPFGFDRLQSLSKSVQLKERVLEEIRLSHLG